MVHGLNLYKLVDGLGEQRFPAVLFVILCKVVLSLDSVNRSLYISKSRFKCSVTKQEMFVTK